MSVALTHCGDPDALTAYERSLEIVGGYLRYERASSQLLRVVYPDLKSAHEGTRFFSGFHAGYLSGRFDQLLICQTETHIEIDETIKQIAEVDRPPVVQL